MSKVYLGFDTSNYSTSFAAVAEGGEVLANRKRFLSVKDGERGLRQSDAVFQHVQNLSSVSDEIKSFKEEYPDSEVAGIGFSEKPRDLEGSYMPCFLVGKGLAVSAASLLSVPYYGFSHQAGHIAAALLGSGATGLLGKEFAAFHVSGGTTDVLYVTSSECGDLITEPIGGTKDLNAGQVIDRAGVMMGLPFPSGKYIEQEALKNEKPVPKYSQTVSGLFCNLSGIENKASQLYAASGDVPLVSAFVLRAVSDTLEILTDRLISLKGSIPIVYSGGVMSCKRIKERLAGDGRYFADPEYSSDNAAGVAYLAMLKHISERTV